MKKTKKYDHAKIEKKWQNEWKRTKANEVKVSAKKKKFYSLVEFPYPSGDGLHTGHVRGYTAMDIISRKRRAEGFNVLYPIGWDAFGLPTENYAIKTGIHPAIVTKRNTDTFRKQLQSLGLSFDWSREINTTDPQYYKWTQWIFLQMFKKGLAYKQKMPINWCPSCKIGLANEEVINETCERCGGPTEKKEKEQWMLAITKYAERLDKDLDKVDYWEKIKLQQKNWIGKSEGSLIPFRLRINNLECKEVAEVFTTRPDTLFGVTYIVLAPEHALVSKLLLNISNETEVIDYIRRSRLKDERERTDDTKEKTGVVLSGITAVNPVNGESVPVFISDYVLAQYGTGAVMAVPAHDTRDYEFASKFGLPIVKVVEGGEAQVDLYVGNGTLINSGEFTGKENTSVLDEITKFAGGKKKTTFKLRDWVFSRQRYWGEPIPIIHCDKCGFVPVPEKNLPVLLPKVKNYKPTETGESPLASISTWVNVKCPNCKGNAKRETDVMPNWAGSSWYFLRYTDPKNTTALAGKAALKYFTPVDWYNGGMEHTTLHLLYSRFWHKFLYDIGVAPTPEPYKKRTSHGIILADGGQKMSKSKGNVINPDGVVKTLGADTLRLYEMFMGPFDQAIAWNTDSMAGSRRFIERVWALQEKIDLKLKPKRSDEEMTRLMHQTIKKVTEDIESMRFNTAVSAMMIYANTLEKMDVIPEVCYSTLIKLLSPFTPHMSEEVWSNLGNKNSVHVEEWPKFSKKLLVASTVKIGVSVNGKARGEVVVDIDLDENSAVSLAKADQNINKWLEGKSIVKVIYVKGRVLNFIIQ